MVKTYCILILSSIFLLGCSGSDSFEGVITYDVEFILLDEDMEYKDYFLQKYGSSTKMYFNQEGDFLRKYEGSGPQGLDFYLYRHETNMFYIKMKHKDTLFYYEMNRNTLDFVKQEEGESEEILGEKCKYITFVGRDETGEVVTQKYHYSGNPYYDPELFEDYKEFFTDKIYAITKSPYRKLELDNESFRVIYTANKIEEKDLDDDLFELPDLPQVYF